MSERIPLMPLPYELARGVIRRLYPVTTTLAKFTPGLELELDESGFEMTARDYLGGAIFTWLIYFASFIVVFGGVANRSGVLAEPRIQLIVAALSLLFSFSILSYILLVPRWISSKKKSELERNLLFAIRHLMVQTTAGVPLFDSIASVSDEYEDPRMNYGQISKEFQRIVKEVRGGEDLASALEESAERNPSAYYRRVLWQLANANKAGANIGYVLKELTLFLSEEQRILIRNYGSQLNPLALFYMLTCVIAPTMGLMFLAIASTLVEMPLTEMTFVSLVIVIVIMQIMFMGLIKSRRPTVAL